ncbi:MAG TPA: hypothetical protein VIX82_11320 [Solirubrobacteraceae bacterium]
MHRRSLLTGAVLVVTGSVALSACGSSSSSSTSTPSSGGASSASSSSSQSSASSSISLPGGSFCQQAISAVAQFGQLGASLQQGAGTLPSLAGIKQVIAADAGVLDSLDGSAPSEIAADVHTIRAALDQANSQVQGATTLQQLSSAFTPLSAPAVSAAGAHISAYVKTACGISSTTTT